MADNIKGLKFFMEGRVNEWLAYKTDKEKIDGFLIEDGDHFVIDIIEQPFHCEASAENGDAKLALYIRNEFGAYMEPDLSIVIHPGNAKPEFHRSGKISGDGMKQLLLFMRAASVLKRYSDRFGFAKLYPDYDPDREGIIVRRDGDEPTFQRVRGKNRPPLAVRNMVGNVELARPYENELVSALGMELSAFEARLEEAEDGDTEAMRDIANKYVTGYEPEEIAPDPKKAYFWMNRLAEEGDPDALYQVGLFSARGFGTPHSFEQAAELMHKAARAGHPKAKQAAAQYETMAKDEAKAKINDAQAMAELAASYMVLAGSLDRDNAEGDYAASRRWAEQSVKAGNGFGYWVLGLLYEHGRGVEKNLERAAELYEHGADLGNREAQNNLGTFLMQGMGLPQDKRRAFSLFQSAAEQGYGVAMRNLGNCYQYAYGTDGNMKKAMEWYKRALDVMDDPELAQKVQLFREMEEVDPDWGKDYPERDDTPREEKLDSPLKEALRAKGRPYDDEAINSLSVEEVFELLGTVEHEYEQYAAEPAGEAAEHAVNETMRNVPEVTVLPQTAEEPEPVPETPAETNLEVPEEWTPEVPAAAEPAPEAPVTVSEPEVDEPDLPETPAEPQAEEPVIEEAPAEPGPSDVMNILFEEPETDEPDTPDVLTEPDIGEPEAEEDLPETPDLPDGEVPSEADEEPALSELFREPAAEASFPDSLELTRAMNQFGVLEPESAVPADAGADILEEEEPEEETEFRERVYESDVMAWRIRNPKYQLSYSEGRNCGNERYRISIPDGFRVEPHAEGRDFIAWLPGEQNANYNSSRITFYAGAEAGQNRIDTRLLTPEICALLTESNYWQADALRLLAEKNRLIVLNEDHPAGSIIAGYNDGNFMYNISIVMPGYIKTMRAQVLGAEEEDIPSCDRMVLEWVRTMTSADAFEETKALDDAYFTGQPLTDRLAAEWKETCDIRYTVLERSCRDNVDLARQRYAKGAYGIDGEAALREDLQEYLNKWAEGYSAFLESGISAIEIFKAYNPGNPSLKKLTDTFRPAVNGMAERTEAVNRFDDTVSASVPHIADLRARFAELIKEPEPETETEVIPAYRELTYHENHAFTLGGLTGLLPDGMITFDQAPENEANDPEFLNKLHSIYSLSAIPSDYEGGFNRYTEGRFCVNIGNPVRNSGFGVLFENGTEADVQSQLSQYLTANLKRNNKYNEHYPAEYVCGGKDYAVAAAQTSGNADAETVGASFVFLVLDQDDLYQGNIYFHSEGSDEQFREAAYNWLETFVRNSTETVQPISTEPAKPVDVKPETREDIEKKFRAERLRNALKKEWKWISLHGKEIARNPQINVEDALFVFTGAAGLTDLPEILNRLESRGGIRRNMVTGRTDYLVCNPAEAGEKKIAAVRELNQNGSEIKIVLLNDLRKALGMEEVDLRTELEQLTGTHIEPEVKLEDIEPEDIQKPAEESEPVEPDKAMSDLGEPEELVTESVEAEPEAPEERLFEDLPVEVLEDRDPSFDTLGFNMAEMETAIHDFMNAAKETETPEEKLPESEPEESEVAEEPDTAETEDTEPETAEPVTEDAAEESEPETEDNLPDDSDDFDEPKEADAEPESADAERAEEESVLNEAEEETAPEEDKEEQPEKSEDNAEIEPKSEEADVQETEETEPEPESETEEPVTEEEVSEDTVSEAAEESSEPETTDDLSEEDSDSEKPEAEVTDTESAPAEGETEEAAPEEEDTEEPSVESEEDEDTESESEEAEEVEPEEAESEEEAAETEEASEATEEPEAEEVPAEPAEDPAAKALKSEALSYLDKRNNELKSFCEDWENFSSTVARTLMLKIKNGIRPKVNEGDDGNKNLSFDSDTSEADEFVDSIPEKVDRKLEKLSNGIRRFNRTLENYESRGLDEMTFLKLCRAFTQFKEAGRNLTLRFTSRDISYPLSEEVEAIGRKWEETYQANKEKLEAFEKEEAEKAPAEPEKPAEPEVTELKPAEEKNTPAVPVMSRALPGGEDDAQMITRTTAHKEIEALLAQNPETKEETKPEKKPGSKFLVILLIIVVLACIGVAAYWFVTMYLPAHQGTSAVHSEEAVAVFEEYCLNRIRL